jgi:hypothetical protein
VEGILVHYASISHVPICFWRAVFERKAKSEIVADLTQLEQIKKKKKFVTQSRTGLQIYEGHDDQLNRPGPMA